MAQAKHRHDDAGPSSESGADKRRHKRRSGMWAAHLELGQEQRVGCIVLNLSEGGANLLLKEPVAIGKIVTLIADSVGARGSRIVWIDGNRAGVEFIEGCADVVGISAAPYRQEFAVTPVRDPAPRSAGLDAQFLRGRAEVLRRLAETTPDPDKAAVLVRSAQSMEAEAARLDEHYLVSSKRTS